MGQRRFAGRVAVAALVLGGVGGTAGLAYAHPPEGGSAYGYGVPCKPGWGHGDRHHCHSGPPGRVHKPFHPDDPETPAKSGHPEHGEGGSHHGRH